ncbi:hypothetical protein DYB25_000604 [Aphanomyces astaci]|uniref:Cyclic nucleotide-binding domain-containing protein n=1 Tax=Aphanomyces astaci TaxID=112090 RepID=A0A397BR35_APHAT|nr:hypothetical protein DYB36_003326 [Aphanomyces astaci]RHY24411.1 hypothetical protein DYB25_000604 [Aphanomyces astaci]RHY56819.1 hypothetical protein DYB38_001613 [Aphanomyces astaci]RHY62882.1 hypothetical protein DYB34_001130 [Aphanomyces astaci]RHZ20917.1 hypothetical protein DYB26_000528 [Aphanomyces astaci]
MQALAHELNGTRRNNPRKGSTQTKGLQLFHATTTVCAAAGIIDSFEIRIQIGNPQRDDESYMCERLQVASYLTVCNVKVLIFKELGIPYEEQTLFHRTVLLEDNFELGQLGIHNDSTIYVVRKKRYRSIGASQTTITTIVLSTSAADGYNLVDVAAPLPPFHMIVKRIAFAISYLRQLDRMQQSHSRHKIWTGGAPHDAQSPRGHRPQPPPSKKQSELATALDALRVSLAVPFEMRTQADIRVIKKWLGSIKYFTDAHVPDSSLLDVSRHITCATYKSGEFVFRQGDPEEGFYVIIQGSLSIAGHGEGLFATMKRGQCFGEVGLFKNCTGQRSASAIVNFDTSATELACVSRDVYIRSIGMHKENMLVEYEQFLSECPQFASLPKERMTLLAYAADSKYVDSGDFLLRNGTHNTDHLQDSHHQPEVCSKLKNPQSQYDVEATSPCTLLSFSKATLQRFVTNHDTAVRDILKDFELRNQDMARRLEQVVAHVMAQEPKPDVEMVALDAFFAHTLSKHGDARSMSTVSQPFPRRLTFVRPSQPPPTHAPIPPSSRGATPRGPKPKHESGFTTAFAAMCKNHFHETLPHGDLLTYEQQVHYSSKPSSSLTSEEQLTKMNCLIDGLRRIKPVDVVLVDVLRHPTGDQYCFMAAT